MDDGYMTPYNMDYDVEKIKWADIKKLKSKDYDTIEKLSSFGLSQMQIATALGLNRNNLNDLIKNDERFREAIQVGQTKLKTVILVSQLRMALPDPENNYIGNASMLKHLGNVHLGQAEKIEVTEKQDIHVVLKWGNNTIPELNKKENDKKEVNENDNV
jgi:predicted XRE-type DNA-binding protein